MKSNTALVYFFLIALIYTSSCVPKQGKVTTQGSYKELLTLCQELRTLERPTLHNGVPDYTSATTSKIQQTLEQYRQRLAAFDTSGWLLEQKVDFELLRAEMNALDFNCRILQPWVRDPAFYALVFGEQSDTPDHEGPTSHAAIELWQYTFPLSEDDSKKLVAQLNVIPPLYEQAKTNLTGKAHDLWSAGIGNIKDQVVLLDELAGKTPHDSPALATAINAAKEASLKLITWLEQQLPSKTEPSGIGKDNYTWNLRHVLLVPMTWEDEVTLLSRELSRAYYSLQLEREHNRNLPQLKAYTSEAEFERESDLAVKKMMAFLVEKKVLPVKEYMEPELRKHLPSYLPEEKRNFFANVYHQAPAVLYSHSSHWFEIAKLSKDPLANPVRKKALPFNLWMTRSEGLATSMEETFMQTGLWDNNPRARELVWIMLAQRCARGLASLYAHANEIDYPKARAYQVKWTPKGWTGDESLVGFEQHLYLRQPGYGASYVTGKCQIDHLMMDVGRQKLDNFKLYDFFDQFYAAGVIPVSLIRWQMTGMDDEIKMINSEK